MVAQAVHNTPCNKGAFTTDDNLTVFDPGAAPFVWAMDNPVWMPLHRDDTIRRKGKSILHTPEAASQPVPVVMQESQSRSWWAGGGQSNRYGVLPWGQPHGKASGLFGYAPDYGERADRINVDIIR